MVQAKLLEGYSFGEFVFNHLHYLVEVQRVSDVSNNTSRGDDFFCFDLTITKERFGKPVTLRSIQSNKMFDENKDGSQICEEMLENITKALSKSPFVYSSSYILTEVKASLLEESNS
ncbi:MAG: hypothetical protein ACRCXZ_04370 [Patescibacteria group bacterium]